ncbi:hypothetical protein Mlute_00512 [Meiothermus luteus]|jgi:hypothetical protein|uniref:Uncharacterized protein n=1 Tax=Meiothermus luteus TaxID=2026184 RepID=A0A399EVZ0_9DEIN|nr:hypothetical protein [Meiothermus luteus]RIH88724.1 hypothetical protein Mlute_00512 [Meiothermus luteus]RMH56335.1 MAG: hypothetical protein D6684_05675 [Deinococcota bacterium]
MTEGAFLLLRLFFWLLPGLLAFLCGRAFWKGRTRVALGLLTVALLAASLSKPFPAGLASLLLGGLLGLVPPRPSR